MSVIIKGMKMPSSCEKCRFSGFGGLRNERVVCMFTGANAYMNEVQYLDDCPLIPVPPHGRLIDADALERMGYKLVRDIYRDGRWMWEQAFLDVAPTILEAEEGE